MAILLARRVLLPVAVLAAVLATSFAVEPVGAATPTASPSSTAASFEPAVASQSFSDVPASHPFKSSIAWLVTVGVTTGYPGGTYQPAAPVTRQSIAAFLYRYAGNPEGSHPTCVSAPFTDVPTSHPFCGEIQWLVDSGITLGFPDNTFHPSAPVSRRAFSAFLFRLAQFENPGVVPCNGAPFPDVAPSDPFCVYVQWMASEEIAAGYPDGNFHPADTVTRQSAAAFILRDYGRAHLVEVKQVSSSTGGSNCAVRQQGRLSCWGANTKGQLGDGTTQNRTSARTVPGLTGVMQVGMGSTSVCALVSPGDVSCWGGGSAGQLGNGAYTDRPGPTPVPGLSGVIQIGVGGDTACALIYTGRVKCWGDNYYGGLGDGSTVANSSTPVDVYGITDAVQLVVGAGNACVIRLGGTVKCWGDNTNGELGSATGITKSPFPVNVVYVANAESISLGNAHGCVLISGGTVKCWGWNLDGQVGDGTKMNRNAPVAVAISGATSISAGPYSTCALVPDGTGASKGKCWGHASFGEITGAVDADQTSPADFIPSIDLSGIAIGYYNTCATMVGGTVWCLGDNQYAQLGNGTTTSDMSPDEPVLRTS